MSLSIESPSMNIRCILQIIFLIYPISLLLLMLFNALVPIEHDFFGLTRIFARYLFLPLLLLLPFMFMRGMKWLRLTLIACLVIFLFNFGVPWHFNDTPVADAFSLRVLNWNLGLGTEQAQIERVKPLLLEHRAEIIVLEEAHWRWLMHDADVLSFYPHQVSRHWNGDIGVVLLSHYPIVWHDVPLDQSHERSGLRQITAQIEINERIINVIAFHPSSPNVNLSDCMIACYDVSQRNQELVTFRQQLDQLLQTALPTIVVCDCNTTNREPAYMQLSSGMNNVYDATNHGWGNTFPVPNDSFHAPKLVETMMPFVRIDHIFTSKTNIRPTASEIQCPRTGSDHCWLWAQVQIR